LCYICVSLLRPAVNTTFFGPQDSLILPAGLITVGKIGVNNDSGNSTYVYC